MLDRGRTPDFLEELAMRQHLARVPDERGQDAILDGREVDFGSAVNATLRASTGSGSVETPERMVKGSIEKRRVEGAIGEGGPVVRLASRSGSIRVR